MSDKVINVLQVMPEFGLAGAETMCENLCMQLIKDCRFKVTIASLYDIHTAITERLEQNGIEILYLGKKNGLDFSMIKKLTKIMKERKIEVLHTHRYVMQYAIPAAIIARVPVRIHTVHNEASKEQEKGKRILSSLFYRFFKTQSVAISPLIRDTIMEEYGLKKEKIPVVFNGIDLEKCIEKDNYEVTETFRFLHIGRFMEVKNQKLIIEALRDIKAEGYDVAVDFIGGGETEDECKSFAKQLCVNDSIIFYGSQSNVYPFYNKADAFLLPSKYEGMPMTLIEAMGSALPIIAANVGGIPDMIKDGVEGALIHSNVESLKQAMKKIVNDKDLRCKYGKNAKERSSDFSSEKMAEGYKQLYLKRLNCIL